MSKPIIERLKQRIREHGETHKITELCLDDIQIEHFTAEYVKVLEKCINVEYVSFENCGIHDLSNIPSWDKLYAIELCNNK